MLSKKSIVLTGVNNENEKAVLSFESDGQNLSGKIRLYNFAVEPSGVLSLGILTDNGVIKAGLVKQQTMLFGFNVENQSLPSSFSCAVVNFAGGEARPLMYGASSGAILEETLLQVVSSLSQTKNMEEVEKILDENDIDFDDDEKILIENAIDEELEKDNCDKCATCKYRQAFFSQTQAMEENDEEEIIEKTIQKEEDKPFYNEIKDQIEVLFEKNQREDYLEEMIPSSKWIKVEFEEEGDYYVLGLIYKDDELNYICYGVPGVYSPTPPRQLSGYPFWLPLDENKKDGFGYWITYQDASTGESIKAVID